MSIEWLLAKAQSAAAGKGTSQTNSRGAAPWGETCSGQSAESNGHEMAGFSPIHFRCRCGYEGTFPAGDPEVQLSAKRNSRTVRFECPSCGRHLRYNRLTGMIKINKGLLGVFLGEFR